MHRAFIAIAVIAAAAVLVPAAAVLTEAQTDANRITVSCTDCMSHESIAITFTGALDNNARIIVIHNDQPSSIENERINHSNGTYVYTFIPDHQEEWDRYGGEGVYTAKFSHGGQYYYSEPFFIHELKEAEELNRLADIAESTEQHLAKQSGWMRAIATTLQAQNTILNSTNQALYSSGYENGRAAGFQEGLVACSGSQS